MLLQSDTEQKREASPELKAFRLATVYLALQVFYEHLINAVNFWFIGIRNLIVGEWIQ
jgi:hypothetical protein